MQVSTLATEHPNYPYQLSGDVCVLARCFDKLKSSVAAGYTTGEIRIFNYISKALVATLHGHSAAVSCLTQDTHQSTRECWLASGGCDCDIVLWDLVTQAAVCKLRGHRDAVTDFN